MDTVPTNILDYTDEQLADFNKKLNKKLAIQLAVQAVVATALVVGANLLAKKLDAEADDIQE